MAQLEDEKVRNSISFKILIDILFAFCFNVDNAINYIQFYTKNDLKPATYKQLIENFQVLLKMN